MNKIGHYIIIILFGGFAAVQYNDPDGVKWMFIYGSIIVLPILNILRKPSKLITVGVFAFFLTLLIINFSDLTNWLNAGRPKFIDYEPTNIVEVEGIREYLGIAISALVSALYFIIGIKKSRLESRD